MATGNAGLSLRLNDVLSNLKGARLEAGEDQSESGGSEPGPRANDSRGQVSEEMTYLQPGSVTVCPGGWHLAPPSFGPLLLLPGPKSGSASAAGASAPSTPSVANAIARRFLMSTSIMG